MSTCVNKYLGGREAANRRFPGPVAADHKIFIATNTNICPHSEAHTDYIFVTQNRNKFADKKEPLPV